MKDKLVGTLAFEEYKKQVSAAKQMHVAPGELPAQLEFKVLQFLVENYLNYTGFFNMKAVLAKNLDNIMLEIYQSDEQSFDYPLGITPLFVQDSNVFFLPLIESFCGSQKQAYAIGHGMTHGASMVPGLQFTGQCVIVTHNTENVAGELVGLPVCIVAGAQFDVNRLQTGHNRAHDVLWAQFHMLIKDGDKDGVESFVRGLTPIELHRMLIYNALEVLPNIKNLQALLNNIALAFKMVAEYAPVEPCQHCGRLATVYGHPNTCPLYDADIDGILELEGKIRKAIMHNEKVLFINGAPVQCMKCLEPKTLANCTATSDQPTHYACANHGNWCCVCGGNKP